MSSVQSWGWSLGHSSINLCQQWEMATDVQAFLSPVLNCATTFIRADCHISVASCEGKLFFVKSLWEA